MVHPTNKITSFQNPLCLFLCEHYNKFVVVTKKDQKQCIKIVNSACQKKKHQKTS